MPYTRSKRRQPRYRANKSDWVSAVLDSYIENGATHASIGDEEDGWFHLVLGKRWAWIIMEGPKGLDTGEPLQKVDAIEIWEDVEEDYYARELDEDSKR